MAEQLRIGIRGEATGEVTAANTAIAYGSGSVNVFATPAMIGLMEKAALSAVDPLLEQGQTTVGVKIEVQHLAATPVGMKVRAEAELTEIDGRRLIFRVAAYDEREKIGEGWHERFIVSVDKFLGRAAAKNSRK